MGQNTGHTAVHQTVIDDVNAPPPGKKTRILVPTRLVVSLLGNTLASGELDEMTVLRIRKLQFCELKALLMVFLSMLIAIFGLMIQVSPAPFSLAVSVVGIWVKPALSVLGMPLK